MADSNIGSEAVELSEIDKENKGSPEFKRLHSEDSPSVKRQKQSLKKSISWGSRGDALLNRSISSQREYNCQKLSVICVLMGNLLMSKYDLFFG